MILITVGTEKFPFNRLMGWVDALIQQQFLNPEQEDVIVQYGSCTVFPAGVRVYQLLPEEQFQELTRKARVIIGHCGEGTLNLLEVTPRPYILVPRTQRYGEHVDDHQMEMAIALSSIGIPVAWSPADLVKFLADPYRVPFSIPQTAILDLCRRLHDRYS
jgi:UDP-N-acetylglucosamine transferase subunit ALG13